MFLRKAHIIKKNEKNEMPQNIIFFDTETIEKPAGIETELVLKLGVCCYWRRRGIGYNDKFQWFNFTLKSSFWDFVFHKISSKNKIFLVAHNIAFDFRVLAGFEAMKNAGFKTNKLIYNGMTNIWEFKKGNKTICVIDNMNFFKTSLANLGESIGIKKMEMPTQNNKKLLEYCHNDVLIMIEAWKLFLKFLKDNDLGNFTRTIAGQAFNAYRHRFMKTPIYIHTWDKAIKLERESYHGGRTECFYIGSAPKQDYYLVDVNSMYPSLMRNNNYPSRIINVTENINIKELIKILLSHCVTARVLLKTNEPVYPVKRTKLLFPTGEFETVLTTRELIYALANNQLIQIREAAIYESNNLFKDYVDFFYNKRQEYKKQNNYAFQYICKLFLNSLYGKFGQRNEHYEKVGECEKTDDGIFEYFDIQKNDWIKERRVNGIIERSAGLIEGFDSFVAIAAHITADARIKLFEYFKIAEIKNIFYCDTDSLIVNKEGYEKLLPFIGKDLGLLSLKEKNNKLIIRGAKDYKFGDNEVIKGIRKNATKINDNTFEQTRFEGLAGAIRKKRINKMFISTGVKKLSRNYDKGIIGKNGVVTPHII